MATRQKKYVPKAKTTTISAHVKMTLKVRDNFVSVEGQEERSVPTDEDVNVGKEWEALWDSVYATCDEEMTLILKDMKVRK